MGPMQSYRRSTIEAAPNEDVLILLVEAALRREQAAQSAMERGERSVWIHEVHGARAVFIELRRALDHSIVPEVTANVDRVYRWCIHQLVDVARTGDRARMAEIELVTRTLHESWSEAVRLARELDTPATPRSAA